MSNRKTGVKPDQLLGAFKPAEHGVTPAGKRELMDGPSVGREAIWRPTYPKGDLRRMLAVLGALTSSKDGATLVQIAERTGLDKKTVTDLIRQAREQAGAEVDKAGPIYRLVDPGPVLKVNGLKMALTGALNPPKMRA